MNKIKTQNFIKFVKKMAMTQIGKYIEINTEKRFGKPVIKGTRITVYDVLTWLSNGMTREEILRDFPELSEEKINACLAFAAHKEQRHLYVS
jgi:uncharacterized protein (DUF433 family)